MCGGVKYSVIMKLLTSPLSFTPGKYPKSPQLETTVDCRVFPCQTHPRQVPIAKSLDVADSLCLICVFLKLFFIKHESVRSIVCLYLKARSSVMTIIETN